MPSVKNSVVEAFLQAHRVLSDDLRKLEQAAGPKSGESLATLRDRLGKTRSHIAAHFRFEEHNGYMEMVRKREPRLERSIEHLAAEHRILGQSLDSIVAEAQAATSVAEALREKIRAWVKEVRKHEARENDVVQNAFNLDVGPED